ncbi:MAG: DUF4331 family protein [Gemmatimonadota bacterium]|nr:DUF4331 family protein [Gemmatimonadota bacterium]
MRSFRTIFRTVPLLALGALVATGCDDTPEPILDPDGPGVEESRLTNMELTRQVDRFGLPAISTALLDADVVGDPDIKDEYNRSAPADDAQFADEVEATLVARYGPLIEALTADDPQDRAEFISGFVLPDVQPLGDLSGFPNGRRLQDDVIDVEVSLILLGATSGVSDNVPFNQDGAFAAGFPAGATFPFLAPPHTPTPSPSS